MANIQKCVPATEASNDALLLIVNKALGFPLSPVQIGGGRFVDSPATWDGYGDLPMGWTKQRVANYVASASTSQLPISDALATELALPSSQARLTAGEASTLNSALATRANVDLATGGYVPKDGAPIFLSGYSYVFVLTGQSVQRSDAEGGTGPFPTNCSYWNREALSSTSFAPMTSTAGSKDMQIARRLATLGRYCVIMNFAYSATTSADWLPPSGLAWSACETSFTNALALLNPELAGRTPRWIHFHDQGEKNVSDATGHDAALLWAENAAVLFARIEEMAGLAMPHVIGMTKNPQPANYWIDIIRSEQISAAASSAYLINRDSWTYKIDNIHLSHPAGEQTYGTAQANKAVELLT